MIHTCYLITVFLLSVAITLSRQRVAGLEPEKGYNGQERDALYALKATLNDPFLKRNWTGLQCYLNEPPYWYGIQCINGRVTGVQLENMGLTGTIKFDAFVFLPELVTISFRNNSLTGTLMNFEANQQLSSIDLSENKFHGPVSQSLASLNLLTSLQLQGNNLTGQIPEFDQPKLIHFNVSNNDLSGPIPSTPTLQSFGPDSFLGNPDLCGPPTPTVCDSSIYKGQLNESLTPESPPGSNTNSNKKDSPLSHFAVLFLLVVVVALAAVIVLFFLYYKKSKELKKFTKEENKDDEDEQVRIRVQVQGRRVESVEACRSPKQPEESGRSPKQPEEAVAEGRKSVIGREEQGWKLIFLDGGNASFELSDLLKSTAEGLGKGIFGNSYKAVLEDNQAVVVKRLRDLKPMTDAEFKKKLTTIASISHPNLLPPLAYYYSKDEKLLVYPYAEKGNLFNRIHGDSTIFTQSQSLFDQNQLLKIDNKHCFFASKPTPFRWNARLSVARGVAQALEYLHRNSRTANGVIPHGNLKSSNVLLDQDDTVLVNDYGFASLIAAPIASQSLAAYKAPEYQSNRKISHKSDVWSYGALLMELLAGRTSRLSASGGVDLCTWVHRAVREEWTGEIFDVEISAQRSAVPGMLRLLQLAMRCCERSPEKRPDMAEIVGELERIKAVDPDEDSDLSMDRSVTDESASNSSASGFAGDERSR